MAQYHDCVVKFAQNVYLRLIPLFHGLLELTLSRLLALVTLERLFFVVLPGGLKAISDVLFYFFSALVADSHLLRYRNDHLVHVGGDLALKRCRIAPRRFGLLCSQYRK